MAPSAITAPDPLYPIWLHGTVNMLAGASGTGKTALLAGWAVALRDGLTIAGHEPGAVTSVGVLSADRSFIQSSGRWFALAGWPDIPAYSMQDDMNFDLRLLLKKDVGSRLELFHRCLDRINLPPGSVLIAEPITDWLGGNILDYGDCSVACRLLRRVCQVRGITLLGIAHASKQIADPRRRYQRLQDRLAGSTAILGYSDTQMYLAAPEEMGVEHYTLYWNPHHAPAETFALDRTADGLFSTARKLVGGPNASERPKAFQVVELVAWVSQAGAGRLFGEILEWARAYDSAFSERTLHRRLNELIDAGYLIRHKGAYKIGAVKYSAQ